MILGETGQTERATLDDIFRRAAARRPDDLALIDPPDRERVSDGPPRRLTYAEADLIVSEIAGRLGRLGLQTDTVIALQLPNTVESILAFLGVLRAGLIPAQLPLLWRRQEAVAALGRIGAKAIITATRIGSEPHGELAMHVAADLFPIRYVCAFGSDVPDGVVPLDDLFSLDTPDPLPEIERPGNPASHIAAITFDVTPDGLVPVARSHNELIAGGLAVFLESGLAQEATIVSTIPIGSFAGMAVTLMPWLLSGGTLALHHPFDPERFAAQLRGEPYSAVVLPGPALTPLADAGTLTHLKTVIALWRACERMADAPAYSGNIVIDVASFGETGLVANKRGVDGKPVPLACGIVSAPRGTPGSVPVGEIMRTVGSTVAMRGLMVPAAAFPSSGPPYLTIGADGFVDTRCRCRIEGHALVVTAPPAGIVDVGGYRFVQRDLDALVASLGVGAALAALPDALAGQRLAGAAPDLAAAQAHLRERGANSLIAAAFRERPSAQAA